MQRIVGHQLVDADVQSAQSGQIHQLSGRIVGSDLFSIRQQIDKQLSCLNPFGMGGRQRLQQFAPNTGTLFIVCLSIRVKESITHRITSATLGFQCWLLVYPRHQLPSLISQNISSMIIIIPLAVTNDSILKLHSNWLRYVASLSVQLS